jgi:tetratricopeptide (TPR) repeat protein
MVEVNILDGKFKLAIESAKRLVRVYPGSGSVKLLLAHAYSSDGNASKALEVIDSIENPGPEVLWLRYVLRIEGNKSIKDLEKLLSADENNPSILGRLCILSRSANPQKALDYCKRALNIEKNNIKHAIGYSAALVQLKRYPKAIGILRNLIKLDPENYAIRANLATALFQISRFEEAKSEYRWIIQKKPNLEIAYYFLAISHDRLKEYTEALLNYNRFLQLASAERNKAEIDKVNLRVPVLKNEIKDGKGKKKKS